jgi:hypothetical protein
MGQPTVRSRLPLREFAYIDREKVEDFLSALVGGLPSGRRRARKSTSPSVDAGLDAKIASVKRKGGATELSWEEIQSATPASIFHELHSLLEDEAAVRSMQQFDDGTWGALEDGDFIEARCTVERSAVEALFELIERFAKLVPVFAPNQTEDPQWRQIMSYVTILGEQQGEACNVRLLPVGAPTSGHTFVATLDSAKIRANIASLGGTYTVFGRVQRRLRQGDTFDLFSLLPRGFSLSQEQIADLLSKFSTVPPEFGRPPAAEDLVVSHPAIVLTAIAMYR